MTLLDFSKQFILTNTLVRLWCKDNGNFVQVYEKNGNVAMLMEHQIPKSEFSGNEVVGLKDILVLDSNYKEAVNLVIEK
jgi:hypothetical protein